MSYELWKNNVMEDPQHITVYTSMPRDVYDFTHDRDRKCLLAHPDRWHHIPIAFAKEECLRNGFDAAVQNSRTQLPAAVNMTVVLEIDLAKAKEHNLVPLRHNRALWLVKVANPWERQDGVTRAALPDVCYTVYNACTNEVIPHQ